jgi:hypothetical protein
MSETREATLVVYHHAGSGLVCGGARVVEKGKGAPRCSDCGKTMTVKPGSEFKARVLA